MHPAHKRRRQFTEQMLRVLRYHGPMTDELLAFYMSLLGFKPNSAKKKRRQLYEKHLIQRGKATLNRRGHLVQLWEITR